MCSKATDVDPAALGSAVAMNAVLVAVLTGPVVAFTRRRQGTSLLAVCAAIWVVCWLVFGLPLFVHGRDTAFVMLGFAVMSVGETMMAPILSPLAAALAPEGATGRTMAAVTGASRWRPRSGRCCRPGCSASGIPGAFILLQVACCVAAGVAACGSAGSPPRGGPAGSRWQHSPPPAAEVRSVLAGVLQRGR